MKIQPGLFPLLVLFALLGGCSPIKEAQQRWNAQLIQHTDIEPTVAQTYIGAAHLDAVTAIRYTDPLSSQPVTITDEQIFQHMLRLIADGRPHWQPQGNKPAAPLKLTLALDPPQRTVTMMYLPDKNEILLYNVPTVDWPQHYVGEYPVDAAFGPALLQVLSGQIP